MEEPTLATDKKTVESIPAITIRFAGDSGDGMQLVGTRFTDTSALFGNDLATLPSFPAEIRAPQGTIAGVSSFQVQIADFDILTPGDNPEVLVAMNPAALKAHLHDLAPNGMLILNEDAFEEKNITKAGYKLDPRESGELDGYRVFEVPMEKLTKEALKDSEIKGRAVLRSKNMIALGLISWVFNRPLEDTVNWINKKFEKLPEVADANIKTLKTGYNFGITVEAFHHTYVVDKAKLPAGEYTNINGNIGLSWGLVAAAKLSELELFYGSYPITPASDILHELSKHKNFDVITFQAEDEIAAAAATVGASFTGKLAVTGTSGPGLALKSETISLALSAMGSRSFSSRPRIINLILGNFLFNLTKALSNSSMPLSLTILPIKINMNLPFKLNFFLKFKAEILILLFVLKNLVSTPLVPPYPITDIFFGDIDIFFKIYFFNPIEFT